MFDLMNELSELIYVIDAETYELLFVNRAGKKMFGIQELTGQKCYHALQGKNQPCTFCTNNYLKMDCFYTWEYTNTRVHRHYMMKDKLIDWNGRMARIEIAFDMTASENEKIGLKNALSAENLVTECAKLLYSIEQDDTVLELVLEKIGVFLEADRVYIFEVTDDQLHHVHEWCAAGVKSRLTESQEESMVLLKCWNECFDKEKCVSITNLEELRESNPLEYAVLKKQGIDSLITAPMYLNNQLTGYIGVDNYAVHKLVNVTAIISSLAYFIASVLRHSRTLKMLEQLSYCDTLVGVGNRNRYIRDVESRYRACNGPAGVIYVDINGMKQINDRYGHQQGDQVLVDAAQKIRLLFSEDSIYRVGGDEFVVIVLGQEKELFDKKAQDLTNLFAGERGYTASIGTSWSGFCTNIQAIIYEADEKMYHDKKEFYHGRALSGRYRHSVDDILDMTKPGKLQSMIDEGVFQIYMQPKMGMDAQTIIGSEALVRCVRNDGSLLSPIQFIPVLEESRLIRILDFYVFECVCIQIKAWLKKGLLVKPVSVNFSRYTISEEAFAEKVEYIWRKNYIPKELVEIEVTETVEEDDSYDFLKVIQQVKSSGFTISIDDFGIKNANLSLFTSLNFDVLKIDKTLINDLTDNLKAQAVVASIANICRTVGIRLIVEGVETQAQFNILQEIECDGVQGFLFSKPITLEAFEQMYLQPHGNFV